MISARRTTIRIVALVLAAALLAACGDDTETASTATTEAPATTGDSSASAATTAAPQTATTRVDADFFDYTIPAGTGQRIAAGEVVDVLPARLDVHIGDQITIDNQDEKDHIIGPFFVEADETLEYTFVSPGSFSGACSAHSDGQILVVVADV